MSAEPSILITAADVSGDAHAAGLVRALRARLGQVRFVGVGGRGLEQAGCELLARPADRSAMLTGVLGQLRYYRRLIAQVAEAMDRQRPSVHVPVDSPALNWHLAKAARRRGVPVVYYVAPQVWAWAPWRVRKLRRLTDAVACILPFEEPYLRARGVNARFVGHPALDGLAPPDPPDLDAAAASGRWRIAVLPGSRRSEIRAHVPALVEMMHRLAGRFSRAEFTFTAMDESAAAWMRQAAGRDDLPLAIGDTDGVLARSHLAVTKSGTVGLQAAWFGVPMIVFYRVGWLAYHLLGRWLVRTPHVSLVNILAGRELVPELVPWHGDARALAGAAERLLGDVEALKRLRADLLSLARPLRIPPPASAADNAARLVIQGMR